MTFGNRASAWWYIAAYLLVCCTTTVVARDVALEVSHYSHQASNTSSPKTAHILILPQKIQVGGTPDQQTAFQNAVCRGQRLLAMTKEVSPAQSLFTDRDAVFDNGWVIAPDSPPEDFDGTTPPPAGGAFGQPIGSDVVDFYTENGFSTSSTDNRFFAWTQGRGDGSKRRTELPPTPVVEYGRTMGKYENQMNPSAGLIMCNYNYGPKYKIGVDQSVGPVPPLNQLSDVLWFQWKDAVGYLGGEIDHLDYILRRQVTDAETLQVLRAIDATPGHKMGQYPGKTYSMGAPEGSEDRAMAEALLGTPNGSAVAYLLAQHRAELGAKTIPAVSYFGPKYESMWGEKHILFHIVDDIAMDR